MIKQSTLSENVEQLELLHENIADEIDELQSLFENSDNYLLKKKKDAFNKCLKNIISNLTSTNDSIYSVFEEINCINGTDVENKVGVMSEILEEKLTYDEKMYIRLKHGIELN